MAPPRQATQVMSSFLDVPGVSCDKQDADETDSKAGRRSRIGMTPDPEQHLSDDDEGVLDELPTTVERNKYHNTPAVKTETETIGKNGDDPSKLNSFQTGTHDGNACLDDCMPQKPLFTDGTSNPQDGDTPDGEGLENIDNMKSADKDVTADDLDPMCDIEYSSNYEEDEESGSDDTKSPHKIESLNNTDLHEIDKTSVADGVDIACDIRTENEPIQNVDSSSEKNDNSYTSTDYESDEYEYSTDPDNTETETRSDTPTKSHIFNRKTSIEDSNSNDFKRNTPLSSHLNDYSTGLDQNHNDPTTDTESSNKDRQVGGSVAATDYDDDFDSEPYHSDNENEEENKAIRTTPNKQDTNDIKEQSSNRKSFTFDDVKIDNNGILLQTSNKYATQTDQRAGVTVDAPETSKNTNDEKDRRANSVTKSDRSENDNVRTDKTTINRVSRKGHNFHNSIKPIKSRSAISKKVSNVQNREEKKKILRMRPGSVPNKIKENIPVPSRQNLYRAPKDLIVHHIRETKPEQEIRKAPLPLISKHSEKKPYELESIPLKHSRVQSLVKENKIPFEKDRVSSKTGSTDSSSLQQPNLLLKATAHTPHSKDTQSKQVTQRISCSNSNLLTSLPVTRKSQNINDLKTQLIDINNECTKGVREEISSKSEESVLGKVDLQKSNSVRLDKDIYYSERGANASVGLAGFAKNTECECNPLTNDGNGNKINGPEVCSQDVTNMSEKQIMKHKSDETTHNQYSISTASNLTMSGNDSFKSATGKTNRTESFIAGNELITPLASHEKQEENTQNVLKFTGEEIKESALSSELSQSEDSSNSMEDHNDSSVVKHKGYKHRPPNRNLYRSHTRPRHITTKSENKLSKYGLDRPSSPFIFSGTKSYTRQSSLTSELHSFCEDECHDVTQERRQVKTGLADIARLRDIRRQLRLPEDISPNSKTEPVNAARVGEDIGGSTIASETMTIHNGDRRSSVAKMMEETIMSILNDVIGTVAKTAKQPQHILQRRCIATNTDGQDELCCILQPPNFVFNLSVVQCDIIDVHTVTPVTKTRHETLLSNIIKIASPDSGEMGNEAGLILHLPVKDIYLQSWQEPIVRVFGCDGNWVDVEGTAPILHVQDGRKKISVVEVHITKAVTLAVIARPILDKFDSVNFETKLVSSVDPRIEVALGKKQADCQRSILLQMVPVDVHTLTWFSKLHSDDDDYQILSCSPLVTFQISDQHAETVHFKLPYVSLYSRHTKRSALPFSTSCVHSPIPRIPSPYSSRQSASLKLKQVGSATGRTLDTDDSGTLQTPRRPAALSVNTTSQLKRRSKVHVPSGEKHLVILKEGPGKTLKIVSLSKVTEATDKDISFTVYDHSSSAIVVETRTGLQYTSIEEVTKAFIEFISLKKVIIKVYQTLSDVQTLYVDFEACHTKSSIAVDEAAYYNYSQTELLLNEGDVIAYSFAGNIRDKKKSLAQLCYYTYKGFKTSCQIDVQNPYGQRSLPTFHGVIQLYSMSEARVTPVDTMVTPDFDQGWECIIEVPVTLPKVIAKVTSTVSKAPLSLELEEPLTPEFMRLLCRDLRNDWERFAKELRIGRARLQSIKQQNKNTIPEKIVMDILANWLKRQPKVNDKATPLISALKRCNKWQLATELSERQKAISTLRSETVEDIMLQKAILLICKSPCVSRKWRQLFDQLHPDGDVTEEANEIEAVHVKDSMCCRLTLCRWKDRTRSASVWTLVDALRAIRCNVVAEAILSKFSKKRKPTGW